MGAKPDYAGTYKGLVLDTALTKTKTSGMPQFLVRVFLTEYWEQKEQQWYDVSDNNWTLPAYLCLYGREGGRENGDIVPTLNHRQVCDVFGWDGCGFSYLVSTDFSDGTEVQVRVDEEEYNNKKEMRIQWIDKADADPNGGLRGLDESEVKDLEKEFEHLWKAKGGKKAPVASAKKGKPSPAKKEKEEEAGGEDGPPEGDKAAKKAALLAKSKRLKKEQAKASDKGKADPPAKSSKKKKTDEQIDKEADQEADGDNPTVPDDYSKKQAWMDIVELKDPDCDDDTLKATWQAAIAETAEGGDEDNLDAEGWWVVKEQVIGEIGAF